MTLFQPTPRTWNLRAMPRPNIHTGDVLGVGGRLVLVVRSSVSSAKVIPVSMAQLRDESLIFLESAPGEIMSSCICYNEPGGCVTMVARLPESRVQRRPSTYSADLDRSLFREPRAVRTAVAEDGPSRTVVHDVGEPQTTDPGLEWVEEAAQFAAGRLLF